MNNTNNEKSQPSIGDSATTHLQDIINTMGTHNNNIRDAISRLSSANQRIYGARPEEENKDGCCSEPCGLVAQVQVLLDDQRALIAIIHEELNQLEQTV